MLKQGQERAGLTAYVDALLVNRRDEDWLDVIDSGGFTSNLGQAIFAMNSDRIPEADIVDVRTTQSFAEAGIETSDETGVVLVLPDGRRFKLVVSVILAH